MSRPLQTSDLIFPPNSTDFARTLSSIKRSTLSISNRLRSIASDALFVDAVADTYQLPLVANERCGSWYIAPGRKAESGYFKSTDGHMGEWSFSLRRLNVQVLDVVGREGGCIIVDSTRRGKRMPDALSKTVPIWCAVLNRALFPDRPDSHGLFTPAVAVSASEHAQMEARLEGFVEQLRSINLDLEALRAKLERPLRPVWVTQETDLSSAPPSFPDFHLVVLCTASRRVEGGEASESGYIQGAGDDAEGWSNGLTAPLFWEHKTDLLGASDDELPDMITDLLSRNQTTTESHLTLIKPTTWLSVSSLDALTAACSSVPNLAAHAIIECSPSPTSTFQTALKSRYLHLRCGLMKLGSRDLRKELVKIDAFLTPLEQPINLVICCPTGKDLALGTTLAILCRYCSEKGDLNAAQRLVRIDKGLIRQRMAWIATSVPTANPSRATLQSVNSYLMSGPTGV